MPKNFKLELAYLAGLFDGEGCICIRQNGQKKNGKRKQLCLDCGIGMNSEYIPQLFKFHFGGSISKRHPKKITHSPCWYWQVSAQKALTFLEIISSHLRLKKAEAELAIEFQHRLKCRRGQLLSNDEIAYRQAQKILLSSLKRRNVGVGI